MHNQTRDLALEWLNRDPYAVEFRYPDAVAFISPEHAQATLEIAERIYTFVSVRLQ